jgi:hypothetical protein
MSPSLPRYDPRDKSWHTKTQVYGTLAIWPAEALRLGLTLNGLWGGYFTASPIRQGDFMYVSDPEQVRGMHAHGLRTSGVVDVSGVYDAQLAAYPELAAAIDTRVDGTPAVYQTEASYHFMCLHHPAWLNWQIAECRRIIDAEADTITLDNLVPSARGILLASLAGAGSTPGFGDATLDAFRGVAGVAMPWVRGATNHELRLLLAVREPYLYGGNAVKDELLDHFWEFFEAASCAHVERLVDAARSYARSRNRHVVINGNVPLKDFPLGAHGEYVIRFSRYWKLLDLLSSEINYQKGGDNDGLTPLPRQKLVSIHKLGWAINGAPNIMLYNATTVWPQLYQRKLKHLVSIQTAEAYANRQALAHYISPEDPKKVDFFLATAPFNTLLAHNAALFEQARAVYADAAICYPRPHEDTWLSYSGIAQALAESNVQYEVITAYAGRALETNSLRPFASVAVIGAAVTPEDTPALHSYVQGGGKLVVFGTPSISGLGASERVQYVTKDLGREYLVRYANSVRRQITQFALAGAAPLVSLNRDNRDIGVYAYTRPGGLVLHLVNYRHSRSGDKIAEQRNLLVTLRSARRLSDATVASPESPEPQPLSLEALPTTGMFQLRTPPLRAYGIIALRANGS